MRRVGSFVFPIAVVATWACSPPDPDATISPGSLDKAGFEEVVPVLNRRCGSLDCHGSPRRNLRLYGYGGLRFQPTDVPDFPRTTPAEIERNYEAVMGLEPEAMQRFIAGGRRDPRQLTFYLKPRDAQDHKGDVVLQKGDPADLCILTWLTATVHVPSCRTAAAEESPLTSK